MLAMARMFALFLVFLGALSPLAAYSQSTDSADAPPVGPNANVQTLIEIIGDPARRDVLLAELNDIAAQDGSHTASALDTAEPTFVQSLAEATQSLGHSLSDNAASLTTALTNLLTTIERLREAGDIDLIFDTLRDLGITIIATYGVYLVLRFARGLVHRRAAARMEEARWLRRVMVAYGLFVLDLVVVGLSWLVGYTIVLAFTGEAGRIEVVQTLYLNAFAVVMVVHALSRFVFAPKTPALRFSGISDGAAKSLNRLIHFAATTLGYGILLAVPIVQLNVGSSTAVALGTTLILIVILTALVAVLRRRQAVSDWIKYTLGHGQDGSNFVGFIASTWWVPVVLYFISLSAVVLTQPNIAVLPLLKGAGIAFVAVWAGLVTIGWLTQVIRDGITLPERIRERLPLLERRINGFVPKLLIGVRLVVLLAVTIIALDVSGLTNIGAWIISGAGGAFIGTFLTVFFILIFGFLAWVTLSSWVEYRLNPNFGSVPTAREQTLLTILKNAVTIALIIIISMSALSELGVNIAPLIASAGVLGLAIGFGAQKMVEDIITGVFIQLENAVNVGDVVNLGGTTGVVEKLTVRSVSLRDLNGIYHVIPFSNVSNVSNFMKDFSYHVEDMGVAYRENVDDVKQAMLDAFAEMREKDTDNAPFILADLEWMGLNAFGDNAVVLRTRIKTTPGKQWGIGRSYKYYLKQVFDARDIEIPFPQRSIWFGVDKEGNAPSVPMRDARKLVEEQPAARKVEGAEGEEG